MPYNHIYNNTIAITGTSVHRSALIVMHAVYDLSIEHATVGIGIGIGTVVLEEDMSAHAGK